MKIVENSIFLAKTFDSQLHTYVSIRKQILCSICRDTNANNDNSMYCIYRFLMQILEARNVEILFLLILEYKKLSILYNAGF